MYQISNFEMQEILKQKLANSAGYARSDLPQVDFDDIPMVLAYLLNKGVEVETRLENVIDIHFTQNELDLDKVRKKLKSKSDQCQERFYFVSKGLFLLDGHHDLSHCLITAPKAKLTCFWCNCGIKKLIKLVNKFYE